MHPQQFEGVVVPKRHLCEIEAGDCSKPIEQRFIIIAEKVHCLDLEQTKNAIDQMSKSEQEELADRLAILVRETGFINASSIRLGERGDVTESGKRRIYS